MDDMLGTGGAYRVLELEALRYQVSIAATFEEGQSVDEEGQAVDELGVFDGYSFQ